VRHVTAIIEREDDLYVALCPEHDVASQGRRVEEAVQNLAEVDELFLRCADHPEQERRAHCDAAGDGGSP